MIEFIDGMQIQPYRLLTLFCIEIVALEVIRERQPKEESYEMDTQHAQVAERAEIPGATCCLAGGPADGNREPADLHTRGAGAAAETGRIIINDRGEPFGFGPEYACPRYGTTGHDYHTCVVCQARFELYLQRRSSRRAA
jgi:hypothetical protein